MHWFVKLVALLTLAAAPVLAPAPVRAQASECVLDRCTGEAPRRADAPSGSFDYYVFALSWSPGFCALDGSRDREQCAPAGRFGFVVHGLWPQGAGGGSLTDCEAGLRPPSRLALMEARDLFPNEGLARYQWRKHGGCSGQAPAAWLEDVRRARALVAIPADIENLREEKQVEPEDILRRFREANPRLRPGMAAIACPRNTFQEIRICISRDTRDFVPCPDVVRATCRARSVTLRPRA